ncbi:MAG: glycosyltransferase family 39 protein [Candidatus Nanohaloarchaea archaeon]|nr:glycosyltransferase family 39 protein [Candidatus Nanohaloarchaea archaeon]
MNAKKRLQQHTGFAALLILFLLAQIAVIVQIWQKPPLWDTAIYIAMGKALYSGGTIGFWETFRPPVLPLLLGLLWKLNVPLIGTTRLLSLAISAGGTAAIYTGIKDLYSQEEAVYTAGTLLASSIFFSFTSSLLTGILASFLVMGSLLLLRRQQHLAAGIIGSLAFLTRFPAALVGPAAVLYLLLQGYRDHGIRDGVRNAAIYTASFFGPVLIYLGANALVFGDPLEPFIDSYSITASNPATYRFGLYYFKEAVLSNPVFLLLPVGIWVIVRQREWEYSPFILALTAFYGFFTYFPLKIERYTLLFLPLMAFLTARGITAMQQQAEQRIATEKITRLVIVAVLALAMLYSFQATYRHKTFIDQDAAAFYQETASLTGLVASNDPVTAAYGDFIYKPLPPGYLDAQLRELQGRADYYAINGCAWYCTPAIQQCQSRINSFEQQLQQQYTKTFSREGETCTFTIYSTG